MPAGRCSPTSENKDLAWKLIATLEGPEGNIEWNKRIGALPAYKAAEKDPVLRRATQFKGWFEELADPDVVPTVMPTYLEEFAFFKDSLVDQDQPGGPARRPHAGGTRQRVGRLPDQGPAEVPGQEISSGLELAAACAVGVTADPLRLHA